MKTRYKKILSVLLATIICLSSFSIGFVAFAAVIFANHYLISKGEGFIAIPENDVWSLNSFLLLIMKTEITVKLQSS